ncbi:MAG: YicC family protein [Clostridia bacterium]|nr:YicC family protein [Clostridia bacterium]
MIRSMTGFGRGKYENEGRNYTIDVKSVNHKYADISVRLPRFLNAAEDPIRKKVSEYISRGKIDVFVNFENFGSKGMTIRVNKELARAYLTELKDLSEETGLEYNLSVLDISKFPEILKLEDDQDEELIINEVMLALEDALKKFVSMREIEGQKLVEDIKNRIHVIQKKVEEIQDASSHVVEDYIEKLKTRVAELMEPGAVDENRIMQEIVIYSDKSSIEEELTRLKSHIAQFLTLIDQDSPIGKKIDFLIQEMNRETNTIGSKANNIDITNNVIEIKTEIENIREQIQNIE